MNKIKISTIAMLLFAAVMVTGCENDTSKPVESDNPSYNVKELFTVDGVTVYRFSDWGHYVYFTNGNGTVQSTYTGYVKTGKTGTPIRRNVVTLCNNKGRGQER